MELPTYEMLIDNETVDGVFAMSLVESPAILTDYVLLSKDNKINIELKLEKLADKKRHIVSGVALIPDMIIPRNGFNITFSKETVRKISENFLIKGYKDNVTLDHQVSVNGVYLVESWIVEDPEKDKSKALGLDVPQGSWCISMKITDNKLWNEYIETGLLKGFSLEGNFSQKEIEMKEEVDELDKEIKDIYLAINYPASELDSYYKWELGEGDNQCPSCKEYSNQIHTLREWINIAIPTVSNGTVIAGLTTQYKYDPYGTFCEDNCRCRLLKVQGPEFVKKYIKKPW